MNTNVMQTPGIAWRLLRLGAAALLFAASAPGMAQSSTTTWTKVANEWNSFTVSGTQRVRYGANSTWIEKMVTGTGRCTNSFFGKDPLYGVTKQCQVAATTTVPTPTTTTPATPTSTQVALRWALPAAGSKQSNNLELRLTGQAFKNVEIFRNGQMFVRATISADQTSATAMIDTKKLPNGSVTLTAHAWNSPAGATFTSDADAGGLTFVVDNTTAAPTPTPTPDPIAGFWPSGTDGLSRDFHNAFGAWRGRPSTSTWINLLWLPWDWLTAPGLYSTLNDRDPVSVWDMYKDFKGVMVLSMSMAGNGNVSREQYEANMRECANGAYNDEWAKFAENAAARGRNGDNTVVSLAQEFNGTWFKWNPSVVGLDVWKGCWRNVYSAIHSKSTLKVVWTFSATTATKKGNDWSVNNVWEAYPGDEYVDVIGVNRYDFPMFGPTSIYWRDTCGNTQDICYAADYARTHNKPLGLPEWGSDREKGYADNAEFVDKMYNFFKDNQDILMFENTFNTILDGTPGWWHFYPESSINANAAARYRDLW